MIPTRGRRPASEIAADAEPAFHRQEHPGDQVESRRDLQEHLEEARLVEGQIEPDRAAHAEVPAAGRARIADEQRAPAGADVPVELDLALGLDELRFPQVVDVQAGAAVAGAPVADQSPVPIVEAAAAIAVSV